MSKPTPTTLCPGQVLETENHSFRIQRVIKPGGFGVTYEVENMRPFEIARGVYVTVGAKLAMKECFRPKCMERYGEHGSVRARSGMQAEAEHVRKGFIEEARAMLMLQYSLKSSELGNLRSGILPVYHVGVQPDMGVYYYVMPYIEGGDLSKYIGKLSPGDMDALLYRLLKALEMIHGNKNKCLLHKDIKPSNIMLTKNGSPVLIDYGGMALEVHTPTYCAPEQISKGPLGPAVDVFGLGVTLYELIQGKTPVDAMTRMKSEGDDPYDRVTLSAQEDLVRRYTEYGKKMNYGSAWGLRFLQGIDAALTLELKDRWSSAREWRETIYGRLPDTDRHGINMRNLTSSAERSGADSDLHETIFVEKRDEESPVIEETPEENMQTKEKRRQLYIRLLTALIIAGLLIELVIIIFL